MPTTTFPITRKLTGLIAATALALLALPALAEAKPKFGADLSGPLTPVNAPMTCTANPGAGCTRVPVYYDMPPHAGNVPFAPKNGYVHKIKLVATTPGSLRIQMAKVNGSDSSAKARVTRNGPRIDYQGTGAIETFRVKFKVKRYEWLAFKTKYANTLSCGSGFDNEIQFQPVLAPGNPFESADGAADCTHLVQAVM